MISNLDGSLGPRRYFLSVANERTFLHGAPAHLKVPGVSLIWKALLTSKLPMFLSRSHEINGACEKTVFKPF